MLAEMRITYIYQYFATLDRPGSHRCYQTAKRLAARGHDVHVVTSDRHGQEGGGWKVEQIDGFTVHRISNPYSNQMSYPRRLWSFFRFAWASSIRAASIPTDLVFASSTPLTIAIPAVIACRCRRVPMVFEVRDLWPDTPIAIGALRNPLLVWAARQLERFAYRNAARVVALSPGMKDGVVRTGYPENRVHVVPNSADVDLFRVPASARLEWRRKNPSVNNRPMVLYTGTIGRINGVEWLARLAALTRQLNPEICFIVVGEGVEEAKVRRVAAELGVLDRNFFMRPSVPKSEMPALLSASMLTTSVVVNNPALWHNSANKFFDAFAAARPIAINHRGWQADLIEQHEAGLVFPFDDLPRSAEMLVSFVSDPARIAAACKASGDLADREFSRDLLVNRLMDVLEDVVKKGNAH